MGGEVDFPRGGTPKVLVRKTPNGTAAAKKNKKFGDSSTAGTKRTSFGENDGRIKKKFKKDHADEEQNIYEGVFRQVLTPELLTESVRGLAFVKFIGEVNVKLECAQGIQLVLPAIQISRLFSSHMASADVTLDDLFHLGQALAFRITAPITGSPKGKKQSSTITVCPHAVNGHLIPSSLLTGSVLNGAVSSIEEKGAIIDLGLSSSSAAQGFVQDDDLPGYLSLDKLRLGQVALFRVKERPSAATRIIKLSGFVEMGQMEGQSKVLDPKQLMPGYIVQVEPDKVVADGVFVGITNGPKAFIRRVHLPPRFAFDMTRISKSFRACVLCTQPQPNSSMLVLTAHPDIVALSKLTKHLLPEQFKIGSRIVGRVYAVDKHQNIYFQLVADQSGGDEDQKQPLLTAKALRFHIDNVEENLPNFTIGSEHTCRIVGFSMVERQLFVTTRTADLEQRVICAEEAEPGTKLTGEVKAIKPHGLMLSFGAGFTGFVPAIHATDRPTKNWKKNFQMGQKLTCRVLHYDQHQNRLVLTAKKSLIKKPKSEPQITAIDSGLVGTISTGVVLKRLDGGSLLVSFYNRVVGLLPKSMVVMLSPHSVEVGMPLKVRVKSVNVQDGTMILEPLIDDDQQPPQIMPKEHAIGLGKSPKIAPQKQNGHDTMWTKVSRPAKPFQLYTARVLGPWPYGGTAETTTAELLMPGGSIGRLHVSELGMEARESESPMQTFLNRNTGKNVTVKVVCVSRPKSFSNKARDELMEKRQTDRIVECTALPFKLQEARKKLSLIKYRDDFGTGDVVPVFITKTPATDSSVQQICGEINPEFRAIFKPEDKDESTSADKEVPELYDSGELRYGRVLGVNKTKKCHVVELSMITGNSVDQAATMQKLKASSQRKRKRTISGEKEEQQQQNGEMEEESAEVKKTEEEEEKVEENDRLVQLEDDEADMNVDDEEERGEMRNSAEEYEQLVSAHPHSVPAWVGFIRFHLTRKSAAKPARRYELGQQVAERALRTITFQNDSDLALVWRTYLRLEVALGTEDSLREVFKRACAAAKSLEMHRFLIRLLKSQTNAKGREGEIREVYESMVKKFRRQLLEPWFEYGRHLLQFGDATAFRALLKRALHCSEKRKHLTILGRFAQLEERHGDRERAKTMRELINNCKREKGQQAMATDIGQLLEAAVGGTE